MTITVPANEGDSPVFTGERPFRGLGTVRRRCFLLPSYVSLGSIGYGLNSSRVCHMPVLSTELNQAFELPIRPVIPS